MRMLEVRGSTKRLLSSLVITIAAGCAPHGQGDPCTPEAISRDGFAPSEVYVETSSVQCSTRVCMVFHLRGNPECQAEDARCTESASPSNACFSAGGDRLCLGVDLPGEIQITENSPDRVFCTCRCSAEQGNASLPLCQCTDGFRCVPASDPGGGYCVPNALAIDAGICANDAECPGGQRCDATHHCR